MINVNVFKVFIETISNKDENGGQSPAQFNSTLAVVVDQYIDRIIGKLREQYQVGSNKNYALIAKYERYLLEITKKTNDSIDQYGMASVPSDWSETRGLNYNYITQNPLTVIPYQIRECTQIDFAGYESSQLNRPKKKKAIVTYYPGKLKFSPKNLGTAEIIYYIVAPIPFWGYTISNTQEVYTSGTGVNGVTVQIPLAPQCMNELAMLFCQYLGLAIKEEWLEQFSQGEEAKGDQ